MNRTKAVYTGMAVGGTVGFGIVVAGSFVCPVLAPVTATYLAIGGMTGGAVAGSAAALQIEEKFQTKNNS